MPTMGLIIYHFYLPTICILLRRCLRSQLLTFDSCCCDTLDKKLADPSARIQIVRTFFIKKLAHPVSFSFIFGLSKQTSFQFLQQLFAKKCPSSIQCQDLNPQPSERESLLHQTRAPAQIVNTLDGHSYQWPIL